MGPLAVSKAKFREVSRMRLLRMVELLVVCSGSFAWAQNPVPFLSQPLIPASITPGHAGFTMAVHGANFAAGAVLQWNGSPRATTIVTSELLRATITAADVASVGTAWITVANPAPGGGVSNVVYFTVRVPSSTVSFTFTPVPAWDGELLTTGDFNNDGKIDVVGTKSNYPNKGLTIELFEGNGDGTFQAPIPTTINLPNTQYAGDVFLYPGPAFAAGDFNADGKLDLVLAYGECGDTASPVYGMILLNNGDGTFSLTSQPADVLGGNAFFSSVTIADFNRDGILDLAFVAGYGGNYDLSTYLGVGGGAFIGGGVFHMNACCTGLAAGDFNGDGKLDFALANFSGQMNILFGKGSGGFKWSTQYGSSQSNVFAVDVNGDGKLDIVSGGESDRISVFPGEAGGVFGPPSSMVLSNLFYPLAVADFNGDGLQDIVGQGTLSGTAGTLFLKGNGDATFQAPALADASIDPMVGPVDFNGDGKLDFLAEDSSGNPGIALQN